MDDLSSLMALTTQFERLGDTWYAFADQMTIAWVWLAAGDLPAASRWFIRALVGSSSQRDVTGTTIALPVAALLRTCRATVPRMRPHCSAPMTT